MLVGREDALDRAVASLRDGMSLGVVGCRGAGRTTFLDAVGVRMQEWGWRVVPVRGIAPLRSHPLAALAVAGLGIGGGPGRVDAIGEATASLVQTVSERPSVLLLDDWDDLDEVTWGVMDAVRRLTSSPVVASRLAARPPRHPMSAGSSAASLEPAYVIDLPPHTFDEIERVVCARLGGPCEGDTVSRIFAKSGGIVGLALSIVEIGVREGRIVRDESGQWVAGALWSPGLRGVVEAHLDGLDAAARDAIETLALIGPSDLETVTALVDWPLIEELEARGLLHLTADRGARRVVVTPPLVAEYLRSAPGTSRALRLTERIAQRVGPDAPPSIVAVSREQEAPEAARGDAVFIRMMKERVRKTRILAAARWEREASPAAAVAYVTALIQAAAPADQIDGVFAAVPATQNPDDDALIRLLVLRAQWGAYVRRDPDRALDELAARAREGSEDRRLALVAAEVVIRTNIATVPDDLVAMLERATPETSSVRIAVLEALLFVAVVRGQFSRASALRDELSALAPERLSPTTQALTAIALVGLGRPQEAAALASAGIADAHDRLDLDALRAHGSAAAFASVMTGEFDDAERVLQLLLSVGASHWLPPGPQIFELTLASTVAYRRGDAVAGGRYTADLARMEAPDGPLPGQAAPWGFAQALFAAGEDASAGEALWVLAEQLWDRGARFAAVLAYGSALQLRPRRDGYERARPRLAAVEGPLAVAIDSHLSALVNDDAEGLMRAAGELDRAGRPAPAMSALQQAARLFRASGRVAEAAEAEAAQATLSQTKGGRALGFARFQSASLALSAREREVARLAAAGFSNADIARQLVLSVRTVESHMRRILHKLQVTNRSELVDVRELLTGP